MARPQAGCTGRGLGALADVCENEHGVELPSSLCVARLGFFRWPFFRQSGETTCVLYEM